MDYLRRTWAEIDHDALINNYEIIRRTVGDDCMVMGVIKADAYGHGAVEVAHTLEKAGINWFAVSNVEEGTELRRAGITLPVLVLGATPPERAKDLAENSITQAVYCTEYSEELNACAEKSGVTVDVHIKMDTGMHRIGFAADSSEGIKEAAKACRMSSLNAKGIFTHFASADKDGDPDGSYTERQYGLFCGAIDKLAEDGIRFEVRHCCNSAALLTRTDMKLDMVRAGIILYGLRPSEDVSIDGFKPVMSLRTTVAMVKTVHKGDDISYGRTYTADGDRLIATVPVGYADGYIRGYCGSEVLIGGKRAHGVGRICMDQSMIDVTGIDVKLGDTVTLFGTDGGDTVSVDSLAKKAGTINYECVCLLTKRVARVHKKGGKPVKITNLLSFGEDKQ